MAGYQTQKRNLDKPLNVVRATAGYPFSTYKNWKSLLADQSVFSFRTKGQADINPDLDTRIFYNPFVTDAYNTVDTGHEFYSIKRSETISHRKAEFVRKNTAGVGLGNDFYYRGPLWCRPSTGADWDFQPHTKMSQNDIKYWGSRAIARVAPARPATSLATAIGELFEEGLPLAILGRHVEWETRWDKITAPLRASSNAHLAVQFGLMPFVSDFSDWLTAVQSVADILRQYQRDSGKQVRRRYDFKPTITTFTEEVPGNMEPAGLIPPELLAVAGGTVQVTRTKIEKIWFSGAFMYFTGPREGKGKASFNKYYDQVETTRRTLDKVLGLKLSPEVLWNVLPFSWLADYVSSIGDAISNMTAFGDDGLVLRYGYLMRQTQYRDTYVLPAGNRIIGYPVGPLKRSFNVVVRERYKATPFGFGLDPNGFTAKQWSILGALGIALGLNKLG